MSDAFTPMIAPTRETFCTADGTPYRAGGGTLVHVQAGHVAELKARGFRLVPSNWAVTPLPAAAPDVREDAAPVLNPKPQPRTRKPRA